jgi:stress-induced morphogen
MLTTEDVRQLIETAFPGSTVAVQDMTGTSDHFDIRVTAAEFAGKSRIEQHKMVQSALGEHLTTTIHAVQIKTSTPE